MTTNDLKIVLNSLWEVRSKWLNLGIQLDMKIQDLETIAKEKNSDPGDCFIDCITRWLRQGNPPPTWMALIKALRNCTIGFEELAERLERQYLQSSSVTNNDEIDIKFPHIDTITMDEQHRKELEQQLMFKTKEIKKKFKLLIHRFF